MRFKKKHLTDLERCYAAGSVIINQELTLLLASEGKFPCFAYSGSKFEKERVVWNQPGGTMTFVPIPETNGSFLSIHKFFKLYDWEEAEIVWVDPNPDGTFSTQTMLTIPYIHRFDLFMTGNTCHFIGCALAGKKNSREDWSSPGNIFTGILDRKTRKIDQLQLLRNDLYQNHGYCRAERDGKAYGLIGCQQGIFEVHPPQTEGDQWSFRHVFPQPSSDMALADIDHDGVEEMAVIEPFHGKYFRIYKKYNGEYRQVFEHPEVSDFYHVVWGGQLRGRNVFIGGCRREKMQCFVIMADETSENYKIQIIDEGVGPSNVHVIHQPEFDIIVAANREKGEAALYYVYD